MGLGFFQHTNRERLILTAIYAILCSGRTITYLPTGMGRMRARVYGAESVHRCRRTPEIEITTTFNKSISTLVRRLATCSMTTCAISGHTMKVVPSHVTRILYNFLDICLIPTPLMQRYHPPTLANMADEVIYSICRSAEGKRSEKKRTETKTP